MDTLINSYRDEGSDDLSHSNHSLTDLPPPPESTTTITQQQSSSPHETTNGATTINNDNNNHDPMDSTSASTAAELNDLTGEEDDEDFDPPPKKQKHLSLLTPSPSKNPNSSTSLQNGVKTVTTTTSVTMTTTKKVTKMVTTGSKKAKKKSNNANSMWTKPTSRKGKKKGKATVMSTGPADAEDKVLITPIPRFPDKTDDTLDMKICLSKVYKAEKVELSDDRLSAGSTKGYRMVRATRGVREGAWYFEIKVVKLGETGHMRLGFSTEKGDLQAPVGYDANSFGYRDIDGSKVHKAMREKYGEEGYKEGDVIGFYINMPDGDLYAPKPPHLVWFKGQKYMCGPDAKEDPPKVVPGSEISFFKNGVCQGVAFDHLFGGRYYPAASMYTLPNQPNCVVKFNFGPDFEFPPENLDDRPAPKPMIEAPYHGYERQVQNGISDEKKPK